MQIPLELSFRGFEPGPEIEPMIRRKAEKLDKFHKSINSCRVAVEKPHEHATSGNPYRVRIDLTVPPGHELVVDKTPGDHDLHEDLTTVIIDAFHAAERQVRELAERQQETFEVPHEERAVVVRIFEDQGYGFIRTPEGREVYFHYNSVAHGDFDRLAVGTEVRFEETMGEMGPQATTVQIVNKPGERATDGGEEAAQPPAGWNRGGQTEEA